MGAASRDLVDDDRRGWRLGGAVTYVSLALSGLGLPVRAAIGLDEAARTAPELDLLRIRGVEVHVVPLRRGPVFRNLETPAGRRQLSDGPSDPVVPGDLPPAWLLEPASGLVLAPVAEELPDAWAEVAARMPLVALGWQGLLRRLVPGGPVEPVAPAATPLTRAAHLVVVSREDVAAGTQLSGLLAFLAPGATLAVTAGDAGGIVSARGPAGPDGVPGARTVRRYRAIPADRVIDPTGAGDAFLAGLVAARVAAGSPGARPVVPGADVRLAAAVASFTVEGRGVLGVPELAAVAARIRRPASG